MPLWVLVELPPWPKEAMAEVLRRVAATAEVHHRATAAVRAAWESRPGWEAAILQWVQLALRLPKGPDHPSRGGDAFCGVRFDWNLNSIWIVA